jgi:Short C-terminal domain
VETALTKLELKGSGVDVEVKALSKATELGELIRERMQDAHAAPARADESGPTSDADLLAKLAELHRAGVLSEEEFAEKKAEILRRM